MNTYPKKSDEAVMTMLAHAYGDEAKARELLESWRWPHGPVFPHCQNAGEKTISKLEAQTSAKAASARESIAAVPAASNSPLLSERCWSGHTFRFPSG